MVMVFCGWCKKEFNAKVYIHKEHGRSALVCTHCQRTVRSSVKVSTPYRANQKHYHRELVKGDIV